MKKNMGSALLIVILFYLKVITGTFGIVLLVFAVIFVLTSFISFCPIYKIFGFSTCSSKKTE
jgi:hypothetical protein